MTTSMRSSGRAASCSNVVGLAMAGRSARYPLIGGSVDIDPMEMHPFGLAGKPTLDASWHLARSHPAPMTKNTSNGATLRRRFEQAPDVRPSAISGKETPHEILMRQLPGLRRAPGAHGLRAHATKHRAGLRGLLDLQRRDDAGGAAPVVPHPAPRAGHRRLHHDDRAPTSITTRTASSATASARSIRPQAISSTAWRASSAFTTSASGKRRSSRRTSCSRRSSGARSSRSA